MKKTKLLSILLLGLIFVRGQQTGIQFENGLSWEQVKAKAKTENKFIFVDCFATWCGPCKRMDQEVYPLKEIGDYFNAHFINLKLQMDKTSNDAKSVQDWYGDAESLSRLYKIKAYPHISYFFLLKGRLFIR